MFCDTTSSGLGAETGSGARVLVVDDDPNFRALIVGLLERTNCSVQEASSGLEALAIVEVFRPQLVLLDVNIPVVTGYEVCHQLRERYGSSPRIIFLTSPGVSPRSSGCVMS